MTRKPLQYKRNCRIYLMQAPGNLIPFIYFDHVRMIAGCGSRTYERCFIIGVYTCHTRNRIHAIVELLVGFDRIGCLPTSFKLSRLGDRNGIEDALQQHKAKWHNSRTVCRES